MIIFIGMVTVRELPQFGHQIKNEYIRIDIPVS